MDAQNDKFIKQAIEQLKTARYYCVEIKGIFDIIAFKPESVRLIKIIEIKEGWLDNYIAVKSEMQKIPDCFNTVCEIWAYSDEYEWLQENPLKEKI